MKNKNDSCKNTDFSDRKCFCFDPDNWGMSFYLIVMLNKFSPWFCDTYLFIQMLDFFVFPNLIIYYFYPSMNKKQYSSISSFF